MGGEKGKGGKGKKKKKKKNIRGKERQKRGSRKKKKKKGKKRKKKKKEKKNESRGAKVVFTDDPKSKMAAGQKKPNKHGGRAHAKQTNAWQTSNTKSQSIIDSGR